MPLSNDCEVLADKFFKGQIVRSREGCATPGKLHTVHSVFISARYNSVWVRTYQPTQPEVIEHRTAESLIPC